MSGSDDTFVPTTVLKRDVFSETVSGHHPDDPTQRLTRRNLGELPLWSRGVARALARREARALKAVLGIEGVPQLIASDRNGLTRTWMDGTPLHLARPSDATWFEDAERLLSELHARGVTHNDLAKPQNWLALPDGKAGVIDFQLAMLHRRRGRLYRTGVYEDRRHLLKQKQRFAPDLLTEADWKMLEARSGLSEVWRKTGKRAYNYITRQLMNWSDGEGTGDRLDIEGPAILSALKDGGGVGDIALLTYAASGGRIGLYAFVESDLARDVVRERTKSLAVDHIQVVKGLPRDENGAVREDVLTLVAGNRLDEIEDLIAREPDLAPALRPIVDGRENLTDRYLR